MDFVADEAGVDGAVRSSDADAGAGAVAAADCDVDGVGSNGGGGAGTLNVTSVTGGEADGFVMMELTEASV